MNIQSLLLCFEVQVYIAEVATDEFDRMHNSRRSFDLLIALCDPVTLTFNLLTPKS